jgi:small subunit ribosomal protein S19e
LKFAATRSYFTDIENLTIHEESLYKTHANMQKENQGENTLPTPFDVPSSVLIEKLARYLKENIDQITPPEWAQLTKTGSHATLPPQDPNWWYTRAASLLRKIYIHGPIGTQHLRYDYGGRKDRGVRPEHVRIGAGGNIRKIMQQLEAAGLVEKDKNRGRIVSPEGRRLLDSVSTEIKKELEKIVPELKKY